MTGGMLDLFDYQTKRWHPYYLTAKRILQYCFKMKDEKGEDFPILGICQGIQLVAMVLAGDDPDAITDFPIRG